MSEQLSLFDIIEPQEEYPQEDFSWIQPGIYASVGCVMGELEKCVIEKDGYVRMSVYCTMERIKIVERHRDGKWLCVISMGKLDGKKWPKDGTRILLSDDEISDYPYENKGRHLEYLESKREGTNNNKRSIK